MQAIAPKPSASESSRCGVITHGLLSPCELPDKPQCYDIEQVIGYNFEMGWMQEFLPTGCTVVQRSHQPEEYRCLQYSTTILKEVDMSVLYSGKILFQVEVIAISD